MLLHLGSSQHYSTELTTALSSLALFMVCRNSWAACGAGQCSKGRLCSLAFIVTHSCLPHSPQCCHVPCSETGCVPCVYPAVGLSFGTSLSGSLTDDLCTSAADNEAEEFIIKLFQVIIYETGRWQILGHV